MTLTSSPIDLVAFDLDDTLAHSKSEISDDTASALLELLEVRPVCIISGGRFEQFQSQLLAHLPADDRLAGLHLMPTCGTQYLRWQGGTWVQIYAHELSAEERQRCFTALEEESRRLGFWGDDADVFGDRIEDRRSQVTYSALGQAAPVGLKKEWDADGRKREQLRAAVASRLPGLEVRAGGSTSIDITQQGIDKAYGIGALAEQEHLDPRDILFVGDRLEPGGNDFPVLALGVQSHAVRDADETAAYIRELVSRLSS